MKRLIQMTKGALQGPFPYVSPSEYFHKGVLTSQEWSD